MLACHQDDKHKGVKARNTEHMENGDKHGRGDVDIESNYEKLFGDWWEGSSVEGKDNAENSEDNKHFNLGWGELSKNGKCHISYEDNKMAAEMCGDAYTRDCSVYSLHDQLIRSHLHPGAITMQTRLDKLFTRTLTIFTILSICFLFWLQNSPYDIE